MCDAIPSLDTQGGNDAERQVFKAIVSALAHRKDAVCWFQPVVSGVEPDLVLFLPGVGLVVIEVKGWSRAAVKSVTPREVVLRTRNERVENPERQAKSYVNALCDELARQDELVRRSGPHRGKSIVPVRHLVAFPNVTNTGFDSIDLGRVLPRDRVLLQEELSLESESSADELARRLELLADAPPFRCPSLSPTQIRAIRSTVWSELTRVPRGGRTRQALRDNILILDREQLRIARSIGSGHRIVKGPAGSGKTMLLVQRAVHLVRDRKSEQRVLFLCFNISLAAYVKRLLQEQGVGVGDDQVVVRHVFELAADVLREEVEFAGRDGAYYQDVMARAAQRTTEPLVEPFGTVLVDEAQDFSVDMLRLAVRVGEPGANIVLATDPAQDIYGRKRNWKEAGIDASKPPRTLPISYRYTAETADFLGAWLGNSESGEDGLLFADARHFHGDMPELVAIENQESLNSWLVDDIRRRVSEGQYPRSDIAVVYHSKTYTEDDFAYRDRCAGRDITRALEAAAIPARWVSCDPRAKELFDVTSDRVNVLSAYSAKGIDFDLVYVIGLDTLPWDAKTCRKMRRVAYVSMSRARERLVIPYVRENVVVREVGKCIERARMPTP